MNTKSIFELIVEDLGEPQKRTGAHSFWCCPFHAEETPSFHCKDGDAHFYCFGCGRTGNAFTWLKEYRRLSAGDTRRILRTGISSSKAVKNFSAPVSSVSAESLQAAWREVIAVCAAQLWSPVGARAREYLQKRGLHEETLRSPLWRVGFSNGQKIAGVWVEHGIILPCFTTDLDGEIKEVAYIKVRRSAPGPKYRMLKGGVGSVYGAGLAFSSDVLFLTEGEFDCLLLSQRESLGGAGDLVGVATLGAATNRPDFGRWGSWLCSFQHVFGVFDADNAGEQAGAFWKSLSGRVKLVALPGDPPAHDVSDFWKAGGNLADWVMDTLAKHQIS